MSTSNDIHPCGFPMRTVFQDAIYLVNSEGGTPDLDSSLVSDYSSVYHFKRLDNYQVSQWTDLQSNRFMNWFTVATTSVKYMLMGKQSMQAGTYQMVIKNVDSTKNDFTKSILVS